MISRYEAYLDGVALSSISDKLLILDIAHEAPMFENRSVQFAKRHGLYVYDRYKESATVTITFSLRIYDIAERQQMCQEVARWAMNGKILQTNDRPNQRLRVICETPPVIESALGWTDTLSIVFSGYIVPFWEEAVPVTLTLSGSSADGSLYVPGNVDMARVECTITPQETLSEIRIDCESSFITLKDMNVTNEQTVRIYYDDKMNLHIQRGLDSYYSKRSAYSSDDLLLECGKNNRVSFDADEIVSVVFSARGLWL